MTPYGCITTMHARHGYRDEVVAIVLEAAELLLPLGCRRYIVGAGTDDEVTIVVSEVWDSKTHHDDSLAEPAVALAIGRAKPLLSGAFTSTDIEIRGGIGA